MSEWVRDRGFKIFELHVFIHLLNIYQRIWRGIHSDFKLKSTPVIVSAFINTGMRKARALQRLDNGTARVRQLIPAHISWWGAEG
jgi:hypothetical protein